MLVCLLVTVGVGVGVSGSAAADHWPPCQATFCEDLPPPDIRICKPPMPELICNLEQEAP